MRMSTTAMRTRKRNAEFATALKSMAWMMTARMTTKTTMLIGLRAENNDGDAAAAVDDDGVVVGGGVAAAAAAVGVVVVSPFLKHISVFYEDSCLPWMI